MLITIVPLFLQGILVAALLPPMQVPSGTEKGSVHGVVTRADTNEPVSRVRVVLEIASLSGIGASGSTRTIEPVLTDDYGRFSCNDVAPGSYRVFATHNGFVTAEFGQRSLRGAGSAFTLVPGQSVTIGLRLTPAGTVTGKISDSSGEPLAGITVQLLRSKYDSKGKRSFQAEATARTDDHGSYRFYWMTPGRYYVKASTARIDSDSLAPRNGNVFVDPGYVPTFYPGTNDLSAALPIEVQAGTEMSAVDLNLLRQPLYTIKGRVRNSTTGDTPIYVNVALFPRGSSDGLVMGYGGAPYDGKTGRFEFHDVAPGSYWAQATLLQGGFGRPERNVAFEPVDVLASDIEDLVLSFRPGITIKGRLSLSVDPRSTRILPADFERIHVVLEPLTSDIFGTPQATVKNDGSFLIENVAPGEYRLTISGIPPNTYVKEAGLGRLDLLQRFTIREEASDAAEIVISTRSGELSGIVTGRDGMAVPGAFVVLVPELSRDQHLLFKTAMSDQNGAYLLRGLAPGDYRLFVWEEIEPFSYYDPSVLRQYDKFGAPVHIMESITATATTEIIPKK